MEKSEIHFGDWMRTFAGEAPPGFYPELAIRALAVYLILLISIRLMGRRMVNRLSAIEVAAVVSMGAACGIPLMSPDRGVLAGVVVASVVVLMQRVISRIGYGSARFEHISEGLPDELVNNGVVNFRNMRRVILYRERLLAELRSQGILHLGQVSKVYLERNGSFTTVRAREEKPGLAVLHSGDGEFFQKHLRFSGGDVCSRCGTSDFAMKEGCGHAGHEPAVVRR